MKNKKVCLVVIVIAIIAFLLSYIISYANTGETIYVGLTKLNTKGVGYSIGDPSSDAGSQATNAYIWNVTTYDSLSASSASREQRNLYCIKANYGDTWEKNKDTKLAYNLSYDLQADRQDLLNKIVGNGNDADSVVKKSLTEEGYYRELLWILDNSYIENQTDKKEFLDKMGIKYDETSNTYSYEAIDGYDYSDIATGLIDYPESDLIQDSDIKAIQRAAIWYYTNYKQDPSTNDVFNKKSKVDWLKISTDGNNYPELSQISALRDKQAMILYNYLIDAAANNASQYTAENDYTINKGTTINTTGLTQNSNGKYRLSTTRVGSNYVVGPIKIEGSTSGTVAIEVTNQSNSKITGYKFTDSKGTELSQQDIQSLIGKGEFYISVPRNGIEKVNIKINVTQETTKKTLWLKGTEDSDSIKLEAEQPIVEVTRKQETIPTEFEAQPEEFDLALRKYITKVNGQNVANTRVPSIDVSTLKTGTTATYKHRKDPVTVKDNDEVTYNISIYNEGNKAGYATKVVDQLPTGLINSPNNTATVVSKDKSGNTKNTYKLAYNTVTNQITLTIVNTTENIAKTLNAYTEGNLDYETIEIKCKVAQEPDTKNQIVLTNVAWIDEEYNADDKTTITNQKGADRDSEPNTSPNVNKDNMSNYKGNSNNKDDLTDSKYHYEGQQDDDDFEKLVIMPEEKIFDLALFKHIAAISKDQTIENGEYVSDGRQVVSTTWFAKGQGAELNAVEGDANYKANLLYALKKDGAISTTDPENPDCLDAQVLCRVTENATSDRVLVNYAQIADDSDENGNPIDDIDSTPDNFVNPDREFEDDEDLERIKVRTPGQYDLVLVKEDKDGVQLNSTAKFEVTTNGVKEEKEITGRLTIAQNVPVDADHLTDDVYVIKETKAPDEYCEFDGTITITVSKKIKDDGSGYEKSIKYTVVDSKGNDITGKKDANVYLNDDGNIYVEVKNYKEPEIHKGVKDVTNQDSGYNADEVHSWVMESGIPKNIDDYKFYDIVDDIDYRLKFEGTENVAVKIGNTKLTEGTDYKIEYVENATGVQDKTKSGTLTLTFIDTDNGIQASDKIKNNAGEKVQVTFKTTFAKDENGKLLADMGEQIENQAKLEYTNTSSDNKIVKESEKPEVHTGGVTLYKYYVANNQKVSLAGAKFGIYATESDAKNNKNVIATAESDEKGIVRFIGLQYGGDAKSNENNKTENGTYEYDADQASTKYWVAEIEAPAGYEKHNGTIEVIISKDSYNEEKIKYEVENNKLNFDLALRKFITEVQGKELTPRVPQVKIDNGKITYEHSKDPLTVHVDDTIIYTLRIFNEGNIDGYASEIEDDIPDYLEYLPDEETNVNYMWKMYDKDGNETTNPEEAVKVKTTYLSKDNGTDKLLKAFDGKNINYQDVKIAFKVKDPNSNTTIITNHAQISDDSDKDGNPIEDIDSKPGEWNDGEDDQDVEHVKVEYFDLSLLKFVSKVIVIEDGKENVTNTGYNGHEDPEPVVKVELHKKKLNQVTVKFGYGITITNEGDIPGYATEITDYIPEGLRFEASDNPLWTDEGNNVISTRQLENTLLQPGESATVEVVLTWINGPENLALKTNTAEISEDKNEYDVPDRDSTPDNRKEGEDDIDIAKVILAISTGSVKTYFTLATGLLAIVLVGVVLIKKFII